MITIRKLKTLKPGTLRRKTAVVLQSFENELLKKHQVDIIYLADFLELTAEAFAAETSVRERSAELCRSVAELPSSRLLRELNSLRHEILKVLGTEPADWDLCVSHDLSVLKNENDRAVKKRSGIEVYLDDLRSPFNVGSVFRTAEAFGVSKIMLSPDCPSPEHPRCRRSSMGCTELVEWQTAERHEAFNSKRVFALELGGEPLGKFRFPENGIAVIGSEELGISPEARKAAENSGGLVSIPVYGRKGSINVSVAFGIMMQRWSESLVGRD